MTTASMAQGNASDAIESEAEGDRISGFLGHGDVVNA
jgi:hypothetical protein